MQAPPPLGAQLRPAGPLVEAAPEAGPSSRPGAERSNNGRGTALVWLRRDLRLDDNPALTAALKTGGNVVRAAARGRAVSRSTTRQRPSAIWVTSALIP